MFLLAYKTNDNVFIDSNNMGHLKHSPNELTLLKVTYLLIKLKINIDLRYFRSIASLSIGIPKVP